MTNKTEPQTGEVSSDPAPSWESNEEQVTGISGLIELLADAFTRTAALIRSLEQHAVCQRQQQLLVQHQQINSASQLEEQLRDANQRLARLELTTDNLAKEATKRGAFAAGLMGRQETLSFNLDQVRTLVEGVAQKQQQLVDDFIERCVTDHLFKEFLNLQFALTRLSSNGTSDLRAEVRAIAQAIESFLMESGLRVINPPAGAVFEPREHQPIQVVTAEDEHSDGKVAETFNPGLSRNHRVVQPARVAVFKANGSVK